MKISQKLALGFLAIVSLVAVVGFISLYQLHKIAEPLEHDIPETIRVISESSHLDGLAQFIRYYDEVLTQSARNFAFTKDKKWEKRYRDVEPKLDRIIKEAIGRGDEKDKEYFSSVDKANLALVNIEDEAIELVNNGQAEKAVKILEDNVYWNQKKIYEQGLRDYVQRKGAQYDEALATSTEEVESANNQARNLIKTSTRLILVFVAVALILSIGTGYLICYSISNRIAKLKAAIARIGAGNLDTQIEINSNDEIGDLARSFNKMAEDLESTTTSIERLNKEITERKQVEERLQEAKQQAESANIAKNQFLANMSHEIRTPMSVITGFADLLRSEENPDEQKYYVDLIQKAGKSLLRIIDEILDVSRIEAGKLEIKIEDCSLDKLLSGIEVMMQPLAREEGLQFGVFRYGKLPDTIQTDSGRLRQCLMNLIGNAIKFTGRGHVHLMVSADHMQGTPCLRFDVEDTGIGIPQDKYEAVFETFSQADSSHTRQYGGTGLGLTITKQLAQLLGGDLFFTTEEGKGSVFSLVIPAGVDAESSVLSGADEQTKDAATESVITDNLDFSGKVLVADDVEESQILAERILKRYGLEVVIVDNGKEAVEKILQGSFDLILMDIQMPGLNGLEVTRKLREEGITTPIVALTAYAMQEDRNECMAAGCADYISKPIVQDELRRVLSKYVAAESVPA